MTSYSYEDRDKAYALIKQTGDLATMVEGIAQGNVAANPELQAAIANMTGATDLHRQHEALSFLLKKIQDTHMKRVIAAAPKDFTCFVEAVNPDEACKSKVHRFVGERLMHMDENPDSKMAVSMPPGHAKDLCNDTPVLMGDGTSKRLGNIEVGDFVITHTGNSREVVEVHEQGVRETLTLTTQTGRVLRPHPDHPFLTPSGWIPAKDLVAGDVLAQQREFAIGNTSGRSREEFALAGYMLAYGLVRGRIYSRIKEVGNYFRCDDPLILEDVISLAKNLGYSAKVKLGVSYKEEVRTVQFAEPFQYWLENNGLWKAARHTMRIPEWVFKGSYHDIGAFLGAIVSMDAKMVPKRSRHTGAQRQIQIKSRNVGMTKDLRRLIMRLGARTDIDMILENCYNYEPTNFWSLTIREDEDIAFLRKALRIIGVNRRFWEQPIAVRRFFDSRYGEDRIVSIAKAAPTATRCLTVEEDHSFLADGIVVHNSTYCSRLFPAWWLGKRENKKWLQGGHTQRFAEKEFGKKLRDGIIDTAGYRSVFPDVMVRSASVDEIILTNDCAYVVKGVGQGISGYRSHFNNIDDPYPTEKAAQSEVTRNTVWDWFTNDFRTRRLPGAGELIIVTRWHSDDIVGRLEDMIREGQVEPWEIINLPAFSLGEDVDQLNRKIGEPLWGEFFTTEFLLNIKGPMTPNRWESLYQGSPTLSDGNILQRKYLKYYTDLPQKRRGDPTNPSRGFENPLAKFMDRGPKESLPENENSTTQMNPFHRIRTVVSVDSAEKDTARADFSAIQVWIYASDMKHYLVDIVHGKFEFPELIEKIENAAAKWEADIILCETKGAGNQYIQSRQGHAPCSIIGYNPGRDDKSIRFEGTMGMWNAGEVLMPSRAPWLEKYIDELLRFPAGKNDDNVDATSQYLNWHRADGGWKRGVKKLRS